MTLDKITSLADLEFRIKTNKYYKQMALLGAKRCCNTPSKIALLTTHEKVMEFLHKVSVEHNVNSCSAVVAEINACRSKIVEDVAPSPAVEAITPPPNVTPSSDKLKAVVAELKKKASSKKKRSVKTARGARSSARSRTPTRSTSHASSMRGSSGNGNNT